MAVDADGVRYSSSSPSSTRRWKYHVFLSFRGEDTRASFTDHLHATLQRKGIITFRDDEGLERGKVIKSALFQAIEESLYAIVVLSPNYASSTWCLDELLKILHSKKVLGLQVFPIFYGVDPSDIRHQKGMFGKAFKELEEKFIQDTMKVQEWKDALEEIVNLSGWHSKNRHETELIENIAEKVMSKLPTELPFDSDMLVGIESKLAELDSVVGNEWDETQFIGIWGTGGLGKTTLARVFFEQRLKDFEVHCFLNNIREVAETDGLSFLQGVFLSCLNKRMEVGDCFEGTKLIKNMFCNRKILLVLDDVSNVSQLENLAGKKGWFGHGSKIIITTRDKHLLSLHGVSTLYKINFLTYVESLQLFCQKAFKADYPNEYYLELSTAMIKYAGGLPLALKVLGSFLCGRTISEWKDALEKFKKIPPNGILKILKVSFDGLEDDEKTIFLDIACFFNGMEKDYVIQILQSCDLYPIIGIKVLIDKSLLIDDGTFVRMHQMLQEMGKNIVFQESPNDAGQRSRILCLEDANHVLERNKGTKAIRGIALALEKSSDAFWNPEAFSKLSDLNLLIISSLSQFSHCQLNLPHGLKYISSSLKVLEWQGYPLDVLPSQTQLNELVDLKMQYSRLTQLWRGTQVLRRLRSIDLSHSNCLIKTPNFDGIPHLEKLILEGCTKLVHVHPSLGKHKNIIIVNLKDCKSIRTLPCQLEMNRLEAFVLSGCLKVRQLPKFAKGMDCLSVLDLKGTAIAKLPDSLANLIGLTILNLKNCKDLVCLPNNIDKLKAIKIINISGCSKISRLPENLKENKDLEELDVGGTAINKVPSSVNELKVLSFDGCNDGQARPSSQNRFIKWAFRLQRPSSSTIFMLSSALSSLRSLGKLKLPYCNLYDESLPHDIGKLTSLTYLDLSGNNFVGMPSGLISNLLKLECILFIDCPKLQSLPQLPSNLSTIVASNCPSMKHYAHSQQLWELVESFQSQALKLSEVSFQLQELKIAFLCRVSTLTTPTPQIVTSVEQIPRILVQPSRLLVIPGDEVPSWFHNQNYFCEEEVPHDAIAKNVSFIINIPDDCRSSEWWGIGICLVFENDLAHLDEFDVVWWTCRLPKEEFPNVCRFCCIHKQYNYRYQRCILYIRCSSIVVNQLQMLFFTWNMVKKKSVFKIRKCGWRVLCKKDIERDMAREIWDEGCSSSNNDIYIDPDKDNLNEF